MYEDFGVVVDHDAGTVDFKLFFPDNQIDPQQYTRGGLPRIREVRVTGSFQSEIGGVDWDYENAPVLTKTQHPHGWLYSFHIDLLPPKFYEYKYFVEFENGTSRWCGDPCTKYGGAENENSAFIMGGNRTKSKPIQNRLLPKDLVIYELMIDDFTSEFVGNRAPIEAVSDKIPHLKALGVNAVEFMPWTAWPGNDFSWGYDPFLFFSVEHRYSHDASEPLDKLFKLKTMINELHENDIHVIMDGVFNHVQSGISPNQGFPYHWLYENPMESPYVGKFGDAAFFEDLDFANNCTQQFVFDVCKYWLHVFGIDGIRFDYVRGFFQPDNPQHGIAQLILDVKQYANENNHSNISLILEHLPDNRFEAINDTNNIGATGCWFDPLMFQAFDAVGSANIGPFLIRCLNAGKDFNSDKGPVTYIENHDHSTIANHAGGRGRWWRSQPLAIALFTCAGTPMIHNGQEFAEDYGFPEQGDERVKSRPLRWNSATDDIGQQLRGVYRQLIEIRRHHPALRSANFYPDPYDGNFQHFNPEGYGVEVDRDIAIYHRWDVINGTLHRYIVVINASDFVQRVDIPFSDNGEWEDLLSGNKVQVQNNRLFHQPISSNWGFIYHKQG